MSGEQHFVTLTAEFLPWPAPSLDHPALYTCWCYVKHEGEPGRCKYCGLELQQARRERKRDEG